MILWISLICAVIFGIIAFVAWDSYYEAVPAISAVVCGTLIIAAAVMIVIAVIANSGGEAQRAALEEQYNALEFKAETEASRDELGLLNKEFVDEVQKWNINIARKKALQRNFWIGIFYPDIYDDFELIDLNKFKFK